MNKKALVAILLLNSALAFSQEAEFSFEYKTIKLDDAQQGEIVIFEFPFTNSGDAPLIIESISVHCQCTTYEFPKEPVMPGDSATIYVEFNTATVWDYQDRTLLVESNAKKSPHKLRFKIYVDGKDLSK